MFEDLAQSYNSVVEAFNELATTMEVTTEQINYIMGAIKVGGIIAAIIFLVLIVLVFAMNTKIDVLRNQNADIIQQLEQIRVILKRGKNNGTNDVGSNEGNNGRG